MPDKTHNDLHKQIIVHPAVVEMTAEEQGQLAVEIRNLSVSALKEKLQQLDAVKTPAAGY